MANVGPQFPSPLEKKIIQQASFYGNFRQFAAR
jgi:hypothetical protein